MDMEGGAQAEKNLRAEVGLEEPMVEGLSREEVAEI